IAVATNAIWAQISAHLENKISLSAIHTLVFKNRSDDSNNFDEDLPKRKAHVYQHGNNFVTVIGRCSVCSSHFKGVILNQPSDNA
ncbi:NOF-FB transposable element protein, partial [Aphis craccivora]